MLVGAVASQARQFGAREVHQAWPDGGRTRWAGEAGGAEAPRQEPEKVSFCRVATARPGVVPALARASPAPRAVDQTSPQVPRGPGGSPGRANLRREGETLVRAEKS